LNIFFVWSDTMNGTTLAAIGLLAMTAAPAGPAAAQDAAAGEKVFKVQCMACHSNVAGKKGVGPNLLGVVGRPAGSVPDFHYTAANKDSGLTWDAATLDRYLQAPRTVVPGTTMTYAGLKNDTQRADLIAYLATVK
jgi:cytochrome c